MSGGGAQGDITINPEAGEIYLTIGNQTGRVFESIYTAEELKSPSFNNNDTLKLYRVQRNGPTVNGGNKQHGGVWASPSGHLYAPAQQDMDSFMRLTNDTLGFNLTYDENPKYFLTSGSPSTGSTDACACEFRIEMFQNSTINPICNQSNFQTQYTIINKLPDGSKSGVTFTEELPSGLSFVDAVASLQNNLNSIFGHLLNISITSVNGGVNNKIQITNLNIPVDSSVFTLQIASNGVSVQDTFYHQAVLSNLGTEFANVLGDNFNTSKVEDSSFIVISPLATTTCPMLISGNVFNDFNGVTNDSIDGVGINKPNNEQLYAYLVNSLGIVVDSAHVAADGSYLFSIESLTGLTSGVTVKISTIEASINTNAPEVVIPNSWAIIGENIGLAGNDLTPNGILNITLEADNITNVNFGIEQKPVAVVKDFTLNYTPLLNDEINLSAGGNANTGNTPRNLTGVDAEVRYI